MAKQFDFKKEWPKAQKQLEKFGEDTLKLLKKGEKELIRLSKESKLRLDATSLGVKMEQLFYLIGKEYIKSGSPGEKTSKLQKLIKELEDARKKKKTIEKKIQKKKK